MSFFCSFYSSIILTALNRSSVVVFGTVSKASVTLHTVNVSQVQSLPSRPVSLSLVVTLVFGVVYSLHTTVLLRLLENVRIH
jgi:hypothetical protein